jgi:hypothetical protein
MTSMKAWSWLMLGVVLAFISIYGDRIGLGATLRFGWKQTLGLLVGLALIVVGLWRHRARSGDSRWRPRPKVHDASLPDLPETWEDALTLDRRGGDHITNF